MEKRALVVSDRMPLPDVTEWLFQGGYSVVHDHTVKGAARTLSDWCPTKAVVGPFHDNQDVEALLQTLRDLGVELLVIADEEATLKIAVKLHIPCRWIGDPD